MYTVWRDKTDIDANLIGNGSLNKTFRLKCIIDKDCPLNTNNCTGIIVILIIFWWNGLTKYSRPITDAQFECRPKVGTENAIFAPQSILYLSL